MRRATVVLPVPGLPRNTQCRAGGLALMAELRPLPLRRQHVDQLADLRLDRGEADHAV